MADQIKAPLPGLLVQKLVSDGAMVAVGTPVALLETMKIETSVTATVAGTFRWRCQLGEVVEPQQTLGLIYQETPTTTAVKPRTPRSSVNDYLALLCDPNSDQLSAVSQGKFTEYDLVNNASKAAADWRQPDQVVPHHEPLQSRDAGVAFGIIEHQLATGSPVAKRVWIGGDPAAAMGAVSEPECRRIIAAFDLAEELRLPVEWVAISAGARIAWDSGTENMDWCAAVVARIISFTERGGEANIIVAGINVGAQSYWNAEATMLGHHKGILIMLDDSAMVLTGHRALALSGGGKHADDAAIGGYQEVMGPNGQAHHRASNLVEAYRLLFTHYRLTLAGQKLASIDPIDRDISLDDLDESRKLAAVLAAESNPGRKLSFPISPVMHALIDRDAPILAKWQDQADAGGVVVWDSQLASRAIALIGIEARPIPAAQQTDKWLSGATLHPYGSKKVARALNAASGNRPAVILANLAGFDGSGASLRTGQLEFGAEIARAVTNFVGPIIVVALGRFHGGAYVVFSKALNPAVRILALPGSFVSVIGGDAAAGVVFAREVTAAVTTRINADPSLDINLVRAEERNELARKFDQIHSVNRAAEVGSIDYIVPPTRLRAQIAQLLN